MTQPSASNGNDRRDFLKGSAVAIGGAIAGSLYSKAYAGGDDMLKVGLIGCGGRGSGAALNTLKADPNVKLVAIGDAFADRIEESLTNLLKTPVKDRIAVDAEHKFVGFDAYKKVIECCDVVLLCTPPHFRPAHTRAAIEAGKHVFCEKPVAVDGPGVRSFLETARMAKEKKLNITTGLCWRYDTATQELMKRIHGGDVGQIVTMQCSYCGGNTWKKPRQKGWSDMEWQMRNWKFFAWLSGDHIVEQHVHSLDKMAWAMHDQYPVKVTSMGGRQLLNGIEHGHTYDHFSSVYEYGNGVKMFSKCRQMDNCDPDISDYIYGTTGTATILPSNKIAGAKPWAFGGKTNDKYVSEHEEMYKGIRAGKPVNDGEFMAKSTLMAIMARMSAYTGKTITWEQALNSKEDLTPPKYDWISLEIPPVAMPGVTKFT